MVFEERRKWNSVVPGRCVASERTGRNIGKGRCTLREAEVKRIWLNFWETVNLEWNFLNKKGLNMNKEAADRKLLRCTDKDKIRNWGRCSDVRTKSRVNGLVRHNKFKYTNKLNWNSNNNNNNFYIKCHWCQFICNGRESSFSVTSSKSSKYVQSRDPATSPIKLKKCQQCGFATLPPARFYINNYFLLVIVTLRTFYQTTLPLYVYILIQLHSLKVP